MAEIIKVALTNHSEILSQLEVDSVVILCHPLRSPELTHENIRCLDWTLNHQVRKARKNMGEMSVFIPSMKKIKAPYVILCPSELGRQALEKNCETMALKSIAIISESGEVPDGWIFWPENSLQKVYLCVGEFENRGESH